ncbi:MAG: zinc ribbon domain-containing protein [Chloroflexota bacterium]
MARKTLGYTQLEWTCPRCGTRNPGAEKVCLSCGGPQPEDVRFEQPLEQELITGEEAQKIAAQEPDIHCGFCGTRNSAGAATCRQCGADLKQGIQRKAGEVVGAFSTAPVEDVPCPACGAPNPASARFCRTCGAPLTRPSPSPVAVETPRKTPSRAGVIIAVAVLLVVVIGCLLILSGVFNRTTEVIGTVESTQWQTRLVIEALQPVERADWREDIPADAQVLDCDYRYAFTSDEPQAVATEVCGTPYTIDRGTGFGEVVQDCVYQVYAEYCRYSVLDWSEVDALTLSGSDANPVFPRPQLSGEQRIGSQQAVYQIIFLAGGETYTYQTGDEAIFRQAQPGSRWILDVNSRGEVVRVEPAR